MKIAVLIGDGMGDYPLKELGGKTPLQAAAIPNMRAIAAAGTVRLVNTIPAGMSPGSDVANLSIMGFDPRKYYTGRARRRSKHRWPASRRPSPTRWSSGES